MVSDISMQGGYNGYGKYVLQQQALNQAYGNTKRLGSVMQGLKDKYGCEDCFESGPYFARYPVPVPEVPMSVVYPNFFSRIGRFFKGQ